MTSPFDIITYTLLLLYVRFIWSPRMYIADIICEESLAPDVHAHVVLLLGSLPRRHLEAESATAEIVVLVVIAVDAVEVLLEEGADGGRALIGNVRGWGVALYLGEDSIVLSPENYLPLNKIQHKNSQVKYLS